VLFTEQTEAIAIKEVLHIIDVGTIEPLLNELKVTPAVSKTFLAPEKV
jgi:hypothetical protein